MTLSNETWRNARIRTFLALCAASTGVLICLYQHHFTLSFADPESFVRMMIHKCADTMLAGTSWMIFEVVNLCRMARERSVFASHWEAYEASLDSEAA